MEEGGPMITTNARPSTFDRSRNGASSAAGVATDSRTHMTAAVRHRYGPADLVGLEEMAKPAIGEREVLVRVHAAGVDRGVWHVMTGTPYLMRIAGYGLRAPKNPVLGMDLAGVVEAVGQKVTKFQPGDKVFGVGNGTFAEYARAREDKLALKPETLTFEQAAAVAISGTTALQALRDNGHIKPGQHVLIIGASGGVGTYAVQIAKAFGATVTGVCSTAKVDMVRALGADCVLDYTREDFAQRDKRYDLIGPARRPHRRHEVKAFNTLGVRHAELPLLRCGHADGSRFAEEVYGGKRRRGPNHTRILVGSRSLG